jgi:hypothetical protein
VDPANLLANQEDKLTTDKGTLGFLDWLGDKAFNVPTVGQAVGSSLPTLAAGVAGGPAAVAPFAALMGLSEGNQAYEDVLRQNLDSGIDADTAKERATGAGVAYAALATVLEQAGGVFEAGVFKGTIGKTRGGRLLLGFAPEPTEESAQSWAQDLISNAAIPEEAKKKASQIAKDALEAGAGALSFGVIPGVGGALKPNVKETPLSNATAAAVQDPDLSPDAKQAVAEAADLAARATAMAEAGKAAAAKPAPKEAPTAAPEPETEEEAVAASEQATERAAAPLAYSDEAGDAIFDGTAWTLPDLRADRGHARGDAASGSADTRGISNYTDRTSNSGGHTANYGRRTSTSRQQTSADHTPGAAGKAARCHAIPAATRKRSRNRYASTRTGSPRACRHRRAASSLRTRYGTQRKRPCGDRKPWQRNRNPHLQRQKPKRPRCLLGAGRR